jgi:hypothetical protein
MHKNLKMCNHGAFALEVFEEYSFWLSKSNAVNFYCASCSFLVLITLYTSWREFC